MNRTGKRCSSWQPIAMHYYFGPPMHLLSGVDSWPGKIPHASRLRQCIARIYDPTASSGQGPLFFSKTGARFLLLCCYQTGRDCGARRRTLGKADAANSGQINPFRHYRSSAETARSVPRQIRPRLRANASPVTAKGCHRRPAQAKRRARVPIRMPRGAIPV
jgi:hypothetical protein